MTFTRFAVTGILSILFGSLPFATMTTIDTQVAQNQSVVSQARADQARLAAAQVNACASVTSVGC